LFNDDCRGLRVAARRVIAANAVLKSFKDLLNLGNGRANKVLLEAAIRNVPTVVELGMEALQTLSR
jgi:hypothetical protein